MVSRTYQGTGGDKMKQYIVNMEELIELIDFYDIENRKELIGDDNSLKRKKRAICKFLESKKPIKIIAEGKVLKERDLTIQDRLWDYGLYKDKKVISVFDLFKILENKNIKIINDFEESE